MNKCEDCKQFLVCFAEEKNKQIQFNPWVKNQEVIRHMNPCEHFDSKFITDYDDRK